MANELTPSPTELVSVGPAMSALTDMQQRFIVELLTAGDNNFTRAYLAAGFSPGVHPTNASSAASKLAHHPKIQAAMQEEARARIQAGVILATSELMNIVMSNASANIRLKAIAMVLNRSGLHERTEHKLLVEDNRDTGPLVDRIKAISARLGIDPTNLLGEAGVIEDAEFEDVTAPAASAEGIEDLL